MDGPRAALGAEPMTGSVGPGAGVRAERLKIAVVDLAPGIGRRR